jgi:hypothetical protein
MERLIDGERGREKER